MKKLSFGETVRAFRLEANLSVNDLIKQLDGRFSPSYINFMEDDKEIPKPETIGRIADILDIDRDHLLKLAMELQLERHREFLEWRYKQVIKK